MQTLLVTGGAGFIGSCFVRKHIAAGGARIINYDALTYAGNLDSVPPPDGDRHVFVHGDICDADKMKMVFERYRPDAIVHFAAESHVDRSIDGPGEFVRTNVVGTQTLLDASLEHYRSMSGDKQSCFRFIGVSTDEVYGSLSEDGYFVESTPYAPSSPYSASKAAADHLVRAWQTTYGLPTIVTNCSNNYGPYQFPEKLIPLMTLNAIEGKPLPVYGDGLNVRDWLHVDDHCEAISQILASGDVGATYNIGGNCEQTNIGIVTLICKTVQAMVTGLGHQCESLIEYVTDRPGHDRRYAIDASKIKDELGWVPKRTFDTEIRNTVQWYIDNQRWVTRIESGEYQRSRLGTG